MTCILQLIYLQWMRLFFQHRISMNRFWSKEISSLRSTIFLQIPFESRFNKKKNINVFHIWKQGQVFSEYTVMRLKFGILFFTWSQDWVSLEEPSNFPPYLHLALSISFALRSEGSLTLICLQHSSALTPFLLPPKHPAKSHIT